MSIRKIQTQRILEDVIRYLYSTGTNPTLGQILEEVSRYFRKYPVGQPLPMPDAGNLENRLASLEFMNQVSAHVSLNIETLYDVVREQLGKLTDLNALLTAHLELLKTKRKVVTDKVDSYLLSLYDTDGYFFSIGDSFNDLSLTDTNLTSAFVDIDVGSVSLPILSSLTQRMSSSQIQVLGSPAVYVNGQRKEAIREVSSIQNALDGFSNTAWIIEVETDAPAEVVAMLELRLLSGDATERSAFELSKVEFDPYGITPVQVFCEVHPDLDIAKDTSIQALLGTGSRADYIQFGHKIQTSETKISFTDDIPDIDRVLLTLRKEKPDYTQESNGVVKHRYIFGAKEIGLYKAVFDREAVWVSTPLTILSELGNSPIDAVSIVANAHIPANSNLDFYVAAEPSSDSYEGQISIGDFSWRSIDPIDPNVESANRNIVRFKGTRRYFPMITSRVENASDIQLIPMSSTENDLSQRNPTPSIIPGVDIYRLCRFEDDVLESTLKLEEGINTTHIVSIDLADQAVNSLAYWSDEVFKKDLGDHTYGRIDIGNEFFYGGDVNAAGKSVFVETYLECDEDREILVGEFRKSDGNSKTWTIKVFLNGQEVGKLASSVDNILIPWKFNKGLNHVAVLINIPQATTAVPNPELGILTLLGSYQLYDLGTVKLGDWAYTSLFDMNYNERDEPKTFTIHGGEIISRRKPTDNFRLSYAKNTGEGPEAIRLRADLKRGIDSPRVTPRFESYRIRFAYE